jgi:hypothetical protein
MLAVCLGAGWTTLLDQSSLNVAVPALRGSLAAGGATLQWIVAGYSSCSCPSGSRPASASPP